MEVIFNNKLTCKEDMVGKTITSAKFRKEIEACDDVSLLDLTFSDGTSITIEGTYGGYSGRSIDEYRTYLNVGEECSLDYNKQ